MNACINLLATIGRGAIHGIDRLIRHVYRIEPFTNDPDSIIRISPKLIQEETLLEDGTRWRKGAVVFDIHLWNERVQEFATVMTSLSYAQLLLHGFRNSLHLLTEYLDGYPQTVVGLRGEMGFVMDFQAIKNIFERLGFDVYLKDRPGFYFWHRAFWDNLYSYILMWTFYPASLRGKRFIKLNRVEVRMSRTKFMQLYRNQWEGVGLRSRSD